MTVHHRQDGTIRKLNAKPPALKLLTCGKQLLNPPHDKDNRFRVQSCSGPSKIRAQYELQNSTARIMRTPTRKEPQFVEETMCHPISTCLFVFISTSIFMFVSSAEHASRSCTGCRGVWHPCPTTRNEAVGMDGKGNLANFLYLQVMKNVAF